LERAADARSSLFAWPGLDVSDSALKWLMIAPAVVLLVALMLFPLAYSFWLSLNRYNIIDLPRFVGLGNYAQMLGDSAVWVSLRATFTFALPAFALEFLIGFGLALLVNREIRGKGVFRTLMVVPLMLTPVVVAIHFRLMLNYDFGIVNWFLSLFGVARIGWVAHPILAMVSLIAVEVWQQTPFCMLAFAAGLAALPTEVLEAAEVDGASWWQKLGYVTIPMMMPIFLVVALFRSYNIIRQYDLVFGLTSGGPGRVTETLSYRLMDVLTQSFQVGYASAIGYVLFAISLAISLTLIKLAGLKAQVD
jgi:multiple sugar transport system permease protein